VLELLEVRRILEASAASLAAQVISPEQLALLHTEIDDVDVDSAESLIEHDLNFHALIAEASGNSYLASLLSGLNSRTVRARVWRALTQEDAVAQTLAEHRAIVDALTNRDAELARALTIVHVSGVEHWLKRSLPGKENCAGH
jgi:GntR family transcriptional repressor for pyruvate dehydrogenase complex